MTEQLHRELLGHEDVQITMICLHASTERGGLAVRGPWISQRRVGPALQFVPAVSQTER